MDTYLRNRAEMTPWRAIGDFLNGMRAGDAPDSPVLDMIATTNPRQRPDAQAALFRCKEKTVGNPVQMFPHAVSVDPGAAVRDPAVARWLDMLERLKPFNAKGQVAGVHRYLSAAGDLGPVARVVRSLNWTGPVTRAHRDDDTADAALVRYVSLRHLGIHADRLRLVWLADVNAAIDWVVTTVLLDGQWLVLDHYHGDIAGDDAYMDAVPYFSLNAEKCCLHWRAEDPDGAETALQRLASQLRFGRA